MSLLCIHGARIVDPTQNLDGFYDLLCENGVITEIAARIPEVAGTNIDASGLVLAPGFIDMHTHLREPGFTEKEDILSGCKAAAAGGVTTLCAMPNTRPVCDNPETVRYILDAAKTASACVLPVGAITTGLAGETLTDMYALAEAGVCAFSDDGVPVRTAAQMYSAMQIAAELGLPILAHTEDKSLSGSGIVNASPLCEAMGLNGIPNAAEDVGTAREIAVLMSVPQAHLHICHVSTAGSVALIRDAKARGLSVTAETCPHYFILNDEMMALRDADYRMNPPLRAETDRQAILEGVLDGTLDVIATDHAPHTPSEKADFLQAPNGVIGMETSFSASYTALVKSGKMSLPDLIDKMSVRPAGILHRNAGLKIGAAADFTCIDLEEEWMVNPQKLHGKSRNCVFKNRTLCAKVKLTVLHGKIVYDERKKGEA